MVLNIKTWIRNNWISLILLSVLVVIAYVNSLSNGFVSDDIAAIQKNPDVGNFQSVLNGLHMFTAPLTYLIAYKIGGLNPMVFRIINVLFHIGTVWFVFILISLLANTTLAFITAALFAIHPILTESVTWISGGSYIRYSFFFLASFIAYIQSRSNKYVYLFSLLFFFLALSSSNIAFTTSLIFLLYEVSLGDIKKNWIKLSPYFALSFVWGIFFIFQIGPRVSLVSILSSTHPQFMNPFIQIPVAITSYLQLLLWPDALTLYHSNPGMSSMEYFMRLFITLDLIGGLVFLWEKSRYLFFWISFFMISLLPTLTPFGIAWIVAERYVYLGSIGIISAICYLISLLLPNKKIDIIGYLLLIVMVLGLTTRTIIRNEDWKSEDTLWISTGKTSPLVPQTHNNLGDMYGRWGDLTRSAQEFQTAILLNPRYADAYHNLGNTYRQMGSPSAALQEYTMALKYNRGLWQSHQNIAAIYFEEGKYNDSITEIKQAIRIAPQNAQLYVDLGALYLAIGEKANAKTAFLQALTIDPTNQQAKLGLSQLNN